MSDHLAMVNAVIEYIEAHLQEKLNLNNIANAVHYSRYHLLRVFTKTVGLSIHDYVMRRQLSEAAQLLVYTAKPVKDIGLLAGYDTQQAFSSIFKKMYKTTPIRYREQAIFYPLQLRFTLQQKPSLHSLEETSLERRIVFAKLEDIPLCQALVELTIDGFPYYDETDYLKQLTHCITNQRAFIMKEGEIAIGLVLFNPATGQIDFMAVHPQYRDSHLARAFINKLLHNQWKYQTISITTYREGDKADTGYREQYQQLGFIEAEYLVEYGYPTQKFYYQRDLQDGS